MTVCVAVDPRFGVVSSPVIPGATDGPAAATAVGRDQQSHANLGKLMWSMLKCISGQLLSTILQPSDHYGTT